MPGPKPKPPRLESIDGGRSKKAARKHDQFCEDLVRPNDLREEAVPYWDKVVALLKGRIATLQVDSLAVADLALCLARLDAAEAAISEDGLTIVGHRNALVKHPAAQLARDYRESVRKWFACFGMDPSDRLKLGVSTREISPEEQLEALISS